MYFTNPSCTVLRIQILRVADTRAKLVCRTTSKIFIKILLAPLFLRRLIEVSASFQKQWTWETLQDMLQICSSSSTDKKFAGQFGLISKHVLQYPRTQVKRAGTLISHKTYTFVPYHKKKWYLTWTKAFCLHNLNYPRHLVVGRRLRSRHSILSFIVSIVALKSISECRIEYMKAFVDVLICLKNVENLNRQNTKTLFFCNFIF